MTTKTKPLRVRVTPDDLQRYQLAMQRLGLVQLSSYVRWALENATKMVMAGPASVQPVNALAQFAAPAGPPPQVPLPPRRRRVTAAPVAAAPVVTCDACGGPHHVDVCPAWAAPAPVAAPAVRLPSVEEAFGVPLAGGPMPAPIVDGDDWT